MISIPKPIPLGHLVATPAALKAIADSGQTPSDFLDRHVRVDWGDVDDDDKKLNDEDLINGGRVLSAYHTSKGDKIWIITEADRSVTTLLLPEEY